MPTRSQTSISFCLAEVRGTSLRQQVKARAPRPPGQRAALGLLSRRSRLRLDLAELRRAARPRAGARARSTATRSPTRSRTARPRRGASRRLHRILDFATSDAPTSASAPSASSRSDPLIGAAGAAIPKTATDRFSGITRAERNTIFPQVKNETSSDREFFNFDPLPWSAR